MADGNPEWMDEIIGKYLDENPRDLRIARAAVRRYRELAGRSMGPLAFKLLLAEQIDAAALAFSRAMDAARRFEITAEEMGDLLDLSAEGRTLGSLITSSLREGDSAEWLEESFERIAERRERAERPTPAGDHESTFEEEEEAEDPTPGSRYRHAGHTFEVLHRATHIKAGESFEEVVVYRWDRGEIYTRTLADFANRVMVGAFQRIEDSGE